MKPEQIAQIEKIVKDILQSKVNETPPSSRNLLVIIGATEKPLDIIFQQLDKCMQEGWKLKIILSELATKVLDLNFIESLFGTDKVIKEKEITDIPSIVENSSVILLPAFSYPMVGKLALKLVDTPCTYLVYHALCQEKQVLATADTLIRKKHYSEEKIQPLENINEKHVNTLSAFGVRWVTEEMIIETVRDADISYKVFTQTSIISASVIDNLAINVRELVYTEPAVITPLARDHAQQRGIKLICK